MKKNLKLLLAIVTMLFAAQTGWSQTQINATVLLRPSAVNSTFLITNGSGAVVWADAATLLTEGVAINITGNTVGVDPTGLTDLNEAPAATDYLMIYDASASSLKRIDVEDLLLGVAFTISDGTNTQSIAPGNTLLFVDAANGIDPVVSATDQVTFDLDINELTTETVTDFTNDFLAVYDASAGVERKMALGTITAAPSENNVALVADTPEDTNIASGLTLANFRTVHVYLDGVKQRQTTDWITSGNNIQFTFATLANQIVTVVGYK